MEVLTTVDADRIRALRDRDEFFWLDLAGPAPEVLEEAGRLLHLHPLALEDSREFSQRPKLDVYPDALLFVFWTARITDDGDNVEPVEVHLHLSGGWLLTVRHAECLVLDALHDELPGSTETEEYVVYRVLDGLTDALYPVVDQLEGRIDAIESEVLHDPRQPQLGHIHRLKQEVQQLHRRLLAQRDQFAQASMAILSLPGLTRGKREYFRDVGDHLTRLNQSIDSTRDMVTTAMSVNLSLTTMQENETTKRLAAYAALVAVPTMIAGLYGMNFENMPELRWHLGYPVTLLVMASIDVYLFYRFRKTGWL